MLKTRIQQPEHLRKLPHSPLSPQSTLIFRTARDIIQSDGLLGLWRGTAPSLLRNVPGVALYFTGLTQFRGFLATSPYFAPLRAPSSSYSTSTLPKLTAQGNLIAGAFTRVTVGLLLNPVSVIKARYEVRWIWSPLCSSLIRAHLRAHTTRTARSRKPSSGSYALDRPRSSEVL